MASDNIVIKGAKENNLRNISLEIPRNKLVVITGLSGSGKSSLAFDTIYAEGQRRYVESLSAYARQFLGIMEKPNVESIEGLSPAISIDQKGASSNPRSTVGTVTEIYDYLRLLYARIGVAHCPNCGREIVPQSLDQIVDLVLEKPEGTKVNLLAPLVKGRKGQFQKLFKEIADKGFSRLRVDGEIMRIDTDNVPDLGRYQIHNIEAVVDRIAVRSGVRQRLAESLEIALNLSGGTVIVQEVAGADQLFSQHLACLDCGLSFAELTPRLFSFNSPYGACERCTGLGFISELDRSLVVPDPTLSMNQGAIAPWGKPVFSFRFRAKETWFWRQVHELANRCGFSLDTPWCELPEELQNLILYGNRSDENDKSGFEGAVSILERRFRETDSEWAREEIAKYMLERTCPDCHGLRLRPEARFVTVNNMTLPQLTDLAVDKSRRWLSELQLSEKDQLIAKQILVELQARLGFLCNVGLDYLSLSRASATLSGGEGQRIRLATQVGSGLMGVLYILDEPSIGLHQRDNRRLLDTLCSLRDLGNTLIVVEHDEDTMREADHIIDIGPGAGVLGGTVVAQGTFDDICNNEDSLTGAYLSGRRSVPVPERRGGNGHFIEVLGCEANNLKNIDVSFPLGKIITVTGVSGSGKSTLVNEILHKSLAQQLHHAKAEPGKFKALHGIENIDKVIVIDQSPIGRTPRSNPATYTGLFDPIRQIFAACPEAKLRGYQPGRFSFNIKGGRCESCQGQGLLKIEMHFLSDVFVPCEVCKGKRYNRETLDVHFKGKTIADVLDMTAAEALAVFEHLPKIANKLRTLCDVGLGYVRLGQSATTLSGGEAQRMKLATELSKRSTGQTLYLLDEPTTGLHFDDVFRLLQVLQRLVDAGNSMVIIEHNLDVIKSSDWIIDLGPEGGDGGGQIVAQGTPEQVAACPESWTGRFLKPLLTNSK